MNQIEDARVYDLFPDSIGERYEQVTPDKEVTLFVFIGNNDVYTLVEGNVPLGLEYYGRALVGVDNSYFEVNAYKTGSLAAGAKWKFDDHSSQPLNVPDPRDLNWAEFAEKFNNFNVSAHKAELKEKLEAEYAETDMAEKNTSPCWSCANCTCDSIGYDPHEAKQLVWKLLRQVEEFLASMEDENQQENIFVTAEISVEAADRLYAKIEEIYNALV